MKANIDTENNRGFFESAAFNKRDKAIEIAHELAKTECDSNKFCLLKFYCAIHYPLLFDRLNTLELAEDIEEDGRLLAKECPSA